MVFGVRRVCCQQLVDHGQAHTLIWWFLKHAGLFVYVHVHLDDPTAVTFFFFENGLVPVGGSESPTALQQMDTLFLNCHPRLQKWLQLLVGYEEIKACTVSN